jgi:hypothetical protein
VISPSRLVLTIGHDVGWGDIETDQTHVDRVDEAGMPIRQDVDRPILAVTRTEEGVAAANLQTTLRVLERRVFGVWLTAYGSTILPQVGCRLSPVMVAVAVVSAFIQWLVLKAQFSDPGWWFYLFAGIALIAYAVTSL